MACRLGKSMARRRARPLRGVGAALANVFGRGVAGGVLRSSSSQVLPLLSFVYTQYASSLGT
ncbi:hypothetical protein MFUL124B02_17715 [Myxococcus fulvus 124B02]|nr:hypothetical protein MFUL124B02_17715 [Myxococcus fulvus 124B02]